MLRPLFPEQITLKKRWCWLASEIMRFDTTRPFLWDYLKFKINQEHTICNHNHLDRYIGRNVGKRLKSTFCTRCQRWPSVGDPFISHSEHLFPQLGQSWILCHMKSISFMIWMLIRYRAIYKLQIIIFRVDNDIL